MEAFLVVTWRNLEIFLKFLDFARKERSKEVYILGDDLYDDLAAYMLLIGPQTIEFFDWLFLGCFFSIGYFWLS